MNNRKAGRRATAFRAGVCFLALGSAGRPACAANPLLDGFRAPPHAARPHVWWHWMSGNVTVEGAQLDLAWMDRVGVGGVHAFSGGMLEPTVVENPAPFMSPTWREAYGKAVQTAHGYGMNVAIAGSPGWSQTGGPWVKPQDGMKKYVWSEVQVEGGKPLSTPLPHPPGVSGPFMALKSPRSPLAAGAPTSPDAYGDAAVFAFPTPSAEAEPNTSYSSSSGPLPALASAGSDLAATISLPLPAGGEEPFVEVDLGRETQVGAVTIAADPAPGFTVLARDGGGAFKEVASFKADDAEHPAAQQTYAFPAVRARVLRVRFDRPAPPHMLPDLPVAMRAMMGHAPSAITLHRLQFVAGTRADRFEAKAGFQSTADFSAAPPVAEADAVVTPAEVIDLTFRLRPDGALDWTPPAGRWTIVRLGWSLTGQMNGPAEPSATGLEVDKLDPVAVKGYAEALFDLYQKGVGAPLGAAGIDSLLTDSWEAGVQNWTPNLLAEFQRLRGYDPHPWLPVLAGRVVKDAKASDAFLFDFRQTLKDLAVSSHYAVLARAAHDHGMTYYTEVQGDTPRAISDGLTAKAQSDVPTGEFWYRPFATDPGQPSLVLDLEEAASAAHLHGKPLVAAEAMTVAAGTDPWSISPAMLRPVADEIFAHGVNRFLVHESHMQPYADRKPGLELGLFGQFFNRNDTWAEEARPWSDYLARASYMLQQGRFVADVAYVYGEEKNLTQLFWHRFNTDVPKGYGFDYVDPATLMSGLKAEDGRVVSDGGASYRVIYMPVGVDRMTLPAIRKLDALVRAGATLVAKKPVGGFGMQSPDAEVRAAADRLWGDGEGDAAGRVVGAGKVFATSDLAAALQRIGLSPDVDAHGAPVMTLHRRAGDADFYFVTNREAGALDARLDFRVTGRAPAFWSAVDGTTRPLSYTAGAGVTSVSLPLEAHGSGFVVFQKATAATSRTVAPPREVAAQPIAGPWTVSFQPGRGAPATATFAELSDWSHSADPGIRYFSGEATYSRTLKVDPAWLKAGRVLLDLGVVKELAVVAIDGKAVATAWSPPYRVDLTDRLTPGEHRLEVKVVNLWPNRLIGDKQPGATPITWAPQSPYTADSALLPSGLLGPVRLVRETAPTAPTS